MKNKDFTVAGMITSVQHLTTKTGKPYGRFTMEDYNSSHEFTLFSKKYETFRQYLYEGYYLLIRGRVQERPYNPNELECVINSMMQLAVNLYSKTLKVGMTPDMVRFLDDNSLRYTLM